MVGVRRSLRPPQRPQSDAPSEAPSSRSRGHPDANSAGGRGDRGDLGSGGDHLGTASSSMERGTSLPEALESNPQSPGISWNEQPPPDPHYEEGPGNQSRVDVTIGLGSAEGGDEPPENMG
jgi:hypothetical protein